MRKRNKLEDAKALITKKLNENSQQIYKHMDLRYLLNNNIDEWGLKKDVKSTDFVKFLLKEKKLKKTALKFHANTVERYIYGSISIYELALSIMPNAYFTHFTAMYMHKIIKTAPKTVYINYEQSPKDDDPNELLQESITKAFKQPQRTSKSIAAYRGKKICLLNGMHTGMLGVEPIFIGKTQVPTTNMERTLIDITVRPSYAGGVPGVFAAYKTTKKKINVNSLIEMLRKLNYRYPYHQAIGFYLEKAGYPDDAVNQIQKLGMTYDFYLAHEMESTSYSKKWRLFFPNDIDSFQ
jgi:predicted transcriptional regulator of viral defense system